MSNESATAVQELERAQMNAYYSRRPELARARGWDPVRGIHVLPSDDRVYVANDRGQWRAFSTSERRARRAQTRHHRGRGAARTARVDAGRSRAEAVRGGADPPSSGSAEGPQRRRSLWFMGSKSRHIATIRAAVDELAPPGASVLDMFTGSGVVSSALSSKYRVIANDAQRFATAIADARLLHSESDKHELVRELDFERDLGIAFRENETTLSRALSRVLYLEDEFLAVTKRENVSESFVRAYGALYSRFAGMTPLFGEAMPTSFIGAYGTAEPLLSRAAILERRAEPALSPYVLVTAYYANVYFGIRQAIELDSFRFAIDRLDARDPFHAAKRSHYLSALIHAASVSTSGTGTFVQPQDLDTPRRVAAVLERRSISIKSMFHEFSATIAEEVESTTFVGKNAVTTGDWRQLFTQNEDGWSWDGPGAPPDVVYADPPYTSDQYSRYYHALEVISEYGYPPLELGQDGEPTKGRYPRLDRRFRSRFSEARSVEAEFTDLFAACAGIGASLVLSYASESGLLLQRYRGAGLSEEAVLARFIDLARRSFMHVDVREIAGVRHSGQGDASRKVTELLLICRRGTTRGHAQTGARSAARVQVTP